MSAAASVYFFIGLGVVYVLKGNNDSVTDQIPVDMVSNAMIACTAFVATESKRKGRSIMRTFHSGTSASNPVVWKYAFDSAQRYWVTHRAKKSIAKPDFNLVSSPLEYYSRLFASYTSLTQFFGLLGTLSRKK